MADAYDTNISKEVSILETWSCVAIWIETAFLVKYECLGFSPNDSFILGKQERSYTLWAISEVCCFIAVNSYFTKYWKCDKIKGFYVEMIGLWAKSGMFEWEIFW